MSTHIDAALAAALPAPEAGLALAQHLTAEDPRAAAAAHREMLDAIIRAHETVILSLCDDISAMYDADRTAAAIEAALRQPATDDADAADFVGGQI